jgi:actin-related protein
MPYFARSIKIGGSHVTEVLRKALVQLGYHAPLGVESKAWIDDMKEGLCFVSQNPAAEANLNEYKFLAPDSVEVKIGSECYMGPEALFKPSLAGVEGPGVVEVLRDVISSLDSQSQEALCKNILLAGGSTMFDGYADRITSELKNLLPDLEFQILAPSGRKNSAWIGGSIISSVRTFKDLWVSLAEFEEVGASIYGIKCY